MSIPSPLDLAQKKAEELNLRPEQIRLAQYLAMPRAMRPKQEVICEELEISPATLWRWKNDRRVQVVMRELMRRHFFNDLPEILEALKARALQGDPYASKTFIEYIEDWMKQEKGGTTNNFNAPTSIHLTQVEVEQRIIELTNKT